jgi:hypothetical protein
MSGEPVYLRVSVDPKVRKKLKTVAVELDITIADLLRRSVEEYLKARGIEIDMSEGLDTWGGPGRKNQSEDEA